MSIITKNYPCSLEVWWGADEPILTASELYFSNREEVIEYLNTHLQEYKGKDVECYISQSYDNKAHEMLPIVITIR